MAFVPSTGPARTCRLCGQGVLPGCGQLAPLEFGDQRVPRRSINLVEGVVDKGI